jgi:hypothetical protein
MESMLLRGGIVWDGFGIFKADLLAPKGLLVPILAVRIWMRNSEHEYN